MVQLSLGFHGPFGALYLAVGGTFGLAGHVQGLVRQESNEGERRMLLLETV